MGSDKKRSGSIANSNRKLKINGDKPLSDAFLNAFFKVFSADQVIKFDDLFRENEEKLKAIGMDGADFMKHIRDSYTRYQDHKGLDSFYPMDTKGYKYVHEFMQKTIDSVYEAKTSGRLKS